MVICKVSIEPSHQTGRNSEDVCGQAQRGIPNFLPVDHGSEPWESVCAAGPQCELKTLAGVATQVAIMTCSLVDATLTLFSDVCCARNKSKFSEGTQK